MKLPNENWEAIPGWPYHYRLKEYTAEQIERLNRRPTELINAAVCKAREAANAHPTDNASAAPSEEVKS